MSFANQTSGDDADAQKEQQEAIAQTDRGHALEESRLDGFEWPSRSNARSAVRQITVSPCRRKNPLRRPRGRS